MLTHGFVGFAALNAPLSSDTLQQPSNFYLSNYILNSSKFQLSKQTELSIYNVLSGQDRSDVSATGDTINPIGIMSFGPYKLDSQGSISITIVEAVNGLNYEDVINLDESQREIFQQKYVEQGLDSLIKTIDNAQNLFDSNFILNSYPPPSPDLNLLASPASQSITILWDPIESQWINPLTGRQNIEKYVVYHNTKFIGPFDVIKNRIRVHKTFDQNAYF